jgi:pyridinium-3,5-biscarboxylic acid mononucleotide sulfurtransferase
MSERVQESALAVSDALQTLTEKLVAYSPLAIAVSGGVDSMTLATVANNSLKNDVIMVHAISSAVPVEATERVQRYAQQQDWKLELVDAGEMSDERYKQNPVNRCYFCKSNLYARIRDVWPGLVASGANVDDLGDYRPGLLAAKEKNVVHPLIDAGIDKLMVRAIAKRLALTDIAQLPAQPCLSSRVETGITINPDDLLFIHKVEKFLTREFGPGDLRCRITAEGVRVEVPRHLKQQHASWSEFYAALTSLIESNGRELAQIADYQRGSAFLGSADQPATGIL